MMEYYCWVERKWLRVQATLSIYKRTDNLVILAFCFLIEILIINYIKRLEEKYINICWVVLSLTVLILEKNIRIIENFMVFGVNQNTE